MLRTLLFRVDSSLVNPRNPNRLVYPLGVQTVRWRRKPRWLPTAKSKMFRVPERKKLPKDEDEELRRLYNNYRTAMKSITAYFEEKSKQSSTGEEVVAEIKRKEEEDYAARVKLNEEWNTELELFREEAQAKEKEKQLEIILEKIEENKLFVKEQREKAEQLVREEKERSKTYITKDNIDAAIEHALANEVDYNFSIDIEGNIYKGRRARPEVARDPKTIEEQIMASSSSSS